MNSMTTKQCTRCKQEKDISSFNKDKWNKSGTQTQCRKCKNIAQKNDYLKKKEIYLERQRVRRKAYPEKKAAYEAVNKAIRQGVLIRPRKCSRCSRSDQRIEGHHHEGYSKENRINVVFLCTSCHRAVE